MTKRHKYDGFVALVISILAVIWAISSDNREAVNSFIVAFSFTSLATLILVLWLYSTCKRGEDD